MYLSIYRCLLFLLSFGIPIALSITVENVASATLKLGENASMIVTYTLEFEEIFLYLSWFGCDADGVMDGDALITNIGGNVKSKDSRYSLNSDGDFIITNVRANDTGYYGCEVRTNNDRKDYGYNLLTVNYLETPTLELKENNIEVGEIATFTCPSPNGVPMPIIITWIKDDGVLDVSDTEKYPQSDTTLQITGVNEMDEGDYQCRAENAAYSGDEGKLSIKETLTLFLLDVMINISSYTTATNVTITCFAIGSSSLMINLSKDGNVIKTESDSLLTYKIDSVTESDGGSYICTVSNRFGFAEQSEKKVLNYYPPEYVGYITVAPGENATIAPEMLANPDEFTYQWITELNDTDTDPTTFTFKAPDDDVGTKYIVTMKATNNIGSTTIYFKVNVSSVDYCVSNPCGDKGACMPSISTNFDFTCECQQGYSGRYCENIVYACSSGTGLTIGMFFIGIIVGAFGVIGGLIGYTRIKQKASIDKRSTDQRLQDPYMDYVADNTTAGNEKQTYQDLQYREETAYVNAMLRKK